MLEFSGDTKPQGLVSRFPGSSVKIKQGATQPPQLSKAVNGSSGSEGQVRVSPPLAIPKLSLDNIQIAVQPNGNSSFSLLFHVEPILGEVRQVDFVITHRMDPAPKPTYRDRLFNSTTRILEIARCLGFNEMIDAASLEDGILALHDTLLLSRREDVSLLTPFYLLCLEVCQTFVNLITPDMNVSELKNISVSGYNSCQLTPVLLTLFHALSTFVNFICW